MSSSAPYVVCAHLVRAPGTTLLFDTGIVGDAEAVIRYRPRWFPLDEQLAAHGVALSEVDVVVNVTCTPTTATRCARRWPTSPVRRSSGSPGGTPWPSSCWWCPPAGTRPGQLGAGVHEATAPDWVDELMDLDVDVALFAHDLAQWRPPAASFVGSRPGDPWPG